MRRIALLLLLALFAVSPAQAQTAPRPLAEVPMLPLAPGPHPDIEALLRLHWRDYFEAAGPHAFTLDEVRAGRFDLDGDDDPELVLMIDRPDWHGIDGQPLLIATWVDHHWLPVGWGWGEEDQVLVTDESIDGWRTLDIGNYLMRWTAKGYRRDPK